MNIRNFAIIAHIDHGKSTLADRLLELTGTVTSRDMRAQYLDSMDLERERGITIKLKTVRMKYQDYILNLIDTPGHVDFSYEVSRSLAACEGALLVVDATQGIQAQTLSHIQKAIDLGLTIIPVINKVDLPTAAVAETVAELVSTFGFAEAEMVKVSAKTGEGVAELLEAIVKRIPAPTGRADAPLKALIFDSFYDEHRGVVAEVRVFSGQLKKERLQAINASSYFDPLSIGVLTPVAVVTEKLSAGEVGFVASGLKDLSRLRVGDTITTYVAGSNEPLPGYKEVQPVVFMSFYPASGGDFEDLKKALEKLRLTDAALKYTAESSSALGFGFRVGFLGLLHSEIIKERLERDYGIKLIISLPSVSYEVELGNGQKLVVDSPNIFPDPSAISQIREPWTKLSILVPNNYLGVTLDLCKKHRGVVAEVSYFSATRVRASVDLPLSELIVNFFDELKSATSGFASLDYDLAGYRPADIVKLSILVHGEDVPSLAQLVVRSQAEGIGKKMVAKLKDILPRQQFAVAIQAAIGGKILAREDLPTYRKDVLAKMSGGDQRRKDKLTDLQKRGKKKMERLGRVSIPPEVYREVLST